MQPDLRFATDRPRFRIIASSAACPPPGNGAAILILRHARSLIFPMIAGEIRPPKKFKLSASEFLDYELLLMRAKHLKQFQTAPSEVARCRF
jgi:hypothetical protein